MARGNQRYFIVLRVTVKRKGRGSRKRGNDRGVKAQERGGMFRWM